MRLVFEARRGHLENIPHPKGKNPGDVVEYSSDGRNEGTNLGDKGELVDQEKQWRPSSRLVRADGKNPGDIVEASPEVRPKEKLGVPSRWGSGDKHPSKNPRFHHKNGKNPSDFWTIPTQPYPEAHFAVYPEAICVRPILSSCPIGGTVLDPFGGSGTTAKVARDLGRNSICIDINPDYEVFWRNRLNTAQSLDIEYIVETVES